MVVTEVKMVNTFVGVGAVVAKRGHDVVTQVCSFCKYLSRCLLNICAFYQMFYFNEKYILPYQALVNLTVFS